MSVLPDAISSPPRLTQLQPERPNPLSKFYMTDRHIAIAVARGRRVGRKPQIGITVKSFLRCFTFWQLWAIASTCCADS